MPEIAREEEPPVRYLHHKSGPQRLEPVEGRASGEVPRRRCRHVRRADGAALPPVQLDGARHTRPCEAPRIAERGHDERSPARLEGAQRGQVHVVIMIVAEQHGVHPRQSIERDSRRPRAARTSPLNGRRALAELRVREQGQAREAQQESAMSDEGNADMAGRDRAG